MSESSGLRSTTEHEYMKMFGDAVVGSYNDKTGKMIKSAKITLDPEALAARQKMYSAHASRVEGASIIPQAKVVKKGKKSKEVKKRDYPDVEPAPIQWGVPIPPDPEQPIITGRATPIAPKRPVYLHNQMGKIKMYVEDVLDSEMAYALIFANEDDMIFIPNAGETLNFVNLSGDSYKVYFANTVFNWTDDVKRIMILFKTDES